MTKSDVVSKVATKVGTSKQDTEQIIDGFIETIIESMKSHERIEIRGFGAFSIKKQLARKARNPKTGEAVMVAEKFSPVFKISKEFKKIVSEALNGK